MVIILIIPVYINECSDEGGYASELVSVAIHHTEEGDNPWDSHTQVAVVT